MDLEKILLIGNESDVLHCGFTFPIAEGGKRYPSVDHYAHAMILSQLGLEEVHVLDLLATQSSDVSRQAKQLLQKNMPSGHDMASLAQYLAQSRQSYTMLGLRARASQDKRFRQALVSTRDTLLIVCDPKDSELGIGIDEDNFILFTRQMKADSDQISIWMQDNRQRPPEIGQNQLGFFLMWLRYELKEKERLKWLGPNEIRMDGVTQDLSGSAGIGEVKSGDEIKASKISKFGLMEKPMPITVSDFVIALQGIFQPLSNYYAMNIEVKGDTYRSVEHYAYQRLFEALRLSYTEVMKIRTTVKPVDVQKVAKRIFKELQVDESEIENKSSRLARWRQSAMKQKFSKDEYLQRLLVSTGHALLIETTEGDSQWCAGTDEFELQHLFSKKYISAQTIVNWMCAREPMYSVVSHLGGNRAGFLLMELREKYALETTRRISLAAPMAQQQTAAILTNQRPLLSNHMLCFTPESVLHPFHASELHVDGLSEPLPSPAHFVAHAAIKFFAINPSNAQWIMEAREGAECWHRMHHVLVENMQPPLEKIHGWYWEERQRQLKLAMQLQFEQHPSLLRVLLDTGDSLLVCCQRFSSVEAELFIGMRERDFRLLCSQIWLDTKQINDICLRPMAFRPNFFGGNRLGLLLMELRREFFLKGIYPQQLPELSLPPDALLGSDSALENFVPHVPFDIFDTINYTALWANPLLLMLKREISAAADAAAARETSSVGGGANGANLGGRGLQQLEDLWMRATLVKRPPILISHDEARVTRALERLLVAAGDGGGGEVAGKENHNGIVVAGADNHSFEAVSQMKMIGEHGQNHRQQDDGGAVDDDEQLWIPEVVRSVLRLLTSMIRNGVSTLDDLQCVLNAKEKDCNRLQMLRHNANILLKKAQENKLPAHPQPSDLKALSSAAFAPNVFGDLANAVDVPSAHYAQQQSLLTSAHHHHPLHQQQRMHMHDVHHSSPALPPPPHMMAQPLSSIGLNHPLSASRGRSGVPLRDHHHNGMSGNARRPPSRDQHRRTAMVGSRRNFTGGGSGGGAPQRQQHHQSSSSTTPQQQQQRRSMRGGSGDRSGGDYYHRDPRRSSDNDRAISPLRTSGSHLADDAHSRQPPKRDEQKEKALPEKQTTGAVTGAAASASSGAGQAKPPAAKKPKKEVCESELSEGEILSSDED